jgi:transcriptional regulator with XRE-family HTH domain
MQSSSIIRIMGNYLDLNQGELAKYVGVSEGYVSQIMGGRSGFSIEVLERMSDKSGVPVYIIVLLGYPEVAKKFLMDGTDPDLEKSLPAKLKVSIRAELMRLKKSLDRF